MGPSSPRWFWLIGIVHVLIRTCIFLMTGSRLDTQRAKLGGSIQDPSHILIRLGPKGGCLPAVVPGCPMGAEEVFCPGNWLGQLFILILIRLRCIGEGVFILRTQSPLVRVLIAAAILGELVLPEVGVVLVELGALLTVGLLVSLPFFFFWACSRRAPGPSGSSLLDVSVRVSVGDGGSQACSPPQGASWQEERCSGASEKRCG